MTATGFGDVTMTATDSTRSVRCTISRTTRPPALSEFRTMPMDASGQVNGLFESTAEPVVQSDSSFADVVGNRW